MKIEDIRSHQYRRLRDLLREVHERNPFWRARLDAAGFGPLEERGSDRGGDPLALLERLPILTKREVQDDQCAAPPYGTNLSYPLDRFVRLHQTSGTTGEHVQWLDTAESWAWFVDCWRRGLELAGVRAGDRCFFPFSFGPFIGFWAGFEAAGDLGVFRLAGGGMTTAARLEMIARHAITVVACTPTYALHLAEVAEERGYDLRASSVRRVVVAGEPGGSIAATRGRIAEEWGARVIDHCGMTEVGAFGFEPEDEPGSLRVLERDFIVEIVEPETARPASEGERGELVITNLGRRGSPAIRYRTGDLVDWHPVRSTDPETSRRPGGALRGGILGRLDDVVFVRGNNVHPAAIEGVVRRFGEVAEYRVVVLQSGGLTDLRLEIEPIQGLDEARVANLAGRIASAVRDALHFRVTVVPVAEGTLPRFELKARRFVREESP